MDSSIKTKIIWTIGLAPVSAGIGYFARGVIEAWGVLDPYAEQFGRFLRSTDPKLILDVAAGAIFLALYLGALFFIWWSGRKRPKSIIPKGARRSFPKTPQPIGLHPVPKTPSLVF